ncbi:MAG: AgmX/PglI C-terminal domain-containing protein [Bacteriovoracaceae bacterium]|nr:AgmX/PglI C-terminal domain-containing protein [Bacteriovoracaceae bacterium]
MTAVKKLKITPGESSMEIETKRFNKRALIGSVIIHLFFFLIKLPHLVLEHKLKDDPKLIPITMTVVTPPSRNKLVENKLTVAQPEKTPVEAQKVKNGTDRVIPKSDRLGDKTQKVVQDVQKGDPGSKIKTAYKPGTDVRKAPKTTVGSGSAASKVKAVDNNTGGSGDTYKGFDMTNVTDSIQKSGKGLNRLAAKGAKDDGGAGFGTGGGIGNGVGGGTGNGFITGSPNGTANMAKVATNIGSLSGSATGKIDSSRGFDGLAQKGSVSVAGVPIEKISVSNINPDEIRRILRDHIPQFRYCYQAELDSNKNPEGLQGRMTFKFSIGGTGRVTKSEIQSEEISSDKVRDCIKNVLGGIQFPSPGAGKTVDVSQPINFYPKRI